MGEENTRVWWDGTPVGFIRWTEKGLIFHWGDPSQTAIHMPRGTVLRLMAKGTLEIEGYLPVWAYKQQPAATHRNRTAQESTTPKMSNKLNIIARLINKLGGGDPARVSH